MIVKPTVKELLDHAENRYALVIATSRRARQIANGDEASVDVEDKSPVTIAANELSKGTVAICGYEDTYPQIEEVIENEEEMQEENIEE